MKSGMSWPNSCFQCVPCTTGELLVNRDGVRSCVCDATKGYYEDEGKCIFCDYPNALKNDKCQACSNSEKIEDFKCVPCGENQVQAILKEFVQTLGTITKYLKIII